MTDSIWHRRHLIEKARQDKMKELMEEYDITVYYPAKKKLIEDCKKEGHTQGNFHDNGFGWSWFYCSKCGGRYNIEGPNGEKKDD